jgi:prepilin-type N-terminal cleavage/methylation domain-containing protein
MLLGLNKIIYMKKSAFSLIELSVVLMLIGLLIAGVVTGGKLLHNAKIVRQISFLQDFKSEINTFRDTYNQLPGDMDYADTIWGTYHSSSLPNGTGNGDGDGKLEYANSVKESFLLWDHLQLADMQIYNYHASGLSLSSNCAYCPGLPKSVFPEYSLLIADYGNAAAAIAGVTENILTSVITSDTSLFNTSSGSYAVLDAYKIDQKMDDGVANTGELMFVDSDCSFAVGSTGADFATANFSKETEYCHMVYYYDR